MFILAKPYNVGPEFGYLVYWIMMEGEGLNSNVQQRYIATFVWMSTERCGCSLEHRSHGIDERGVGEVGPL